MVIENHISSSFFFSFLLIFLIFFSFFCFLFFLKKNMWETLQNDHETNNEQKEIDGGRAYPQ